MTYTRLSDRLLVLIEKMQESDRRMQELVNNHISDTRKHLDNMETITTALHDIGEEIKD